MNIEELREYCLSVKASSESFPFDETILVFKIMNKMFAYLSIEPKNGEFRVNLKCNIDKSSELRERYEGVKKGDHTKSDMWNSVYLENDVPNNLIKELIDHSVEEVLNNLSKKKQEEYRRLSDSVQK